MKISIDVFIYRIVPFLEIKNIMKLREVCVHFWKIINNKYLNKSNKWYYLYSWYNKKNNIHTRNFIENFPLQFDYEFIEFTSSRFNIYKNLLIRLARTTNINTIIFIWNCNIQHINHINYYRVKLFETIISSLYSTFHTSNNVLDYFWGNYYYGKNNKYKQILYDNDFTNILKISIIERHFKILYYGNNKYKNKFITYLLGILLKIQNSNIHALKVLIYKQKNDIDCMSITSLKLINKK